MTLIAAVVDLEADMALIAADSLIVSTDEDGDASYAQHTDKLYRIGESTVWGFGGSAWVGDRFRAQVEAGAPYETWLDLIGRCREELVKANRASDERASTSALFAGRLGGVLGIVDMDAFGNVNESANSAAIGRGRGPWTVAWHTANRVAGRMDLIERFQAVMETTVDRVYGLERPISAWQIAGAVTRPWPYLKALKISG